MSLFLSDYIPALKQGAVIDVPQSAVAAYPVVMAAAPESKSGAGAISIATHLTKWTTTAADAGTLANGTVIGQLKKIQMIVDGGDGVLTPATANGFATITFADVGDFALLIWLAAGWTLLETGNDADGVTAPAVA